MKCPMCESDNQDGSRFCNSCGGTLTASGVDYSRPSPIYEPARDPSEDEYKQQVMDLGEAWSLARIAFLPILMLTTGFFACVMMYDGLTDGNSEMLVAGIVFTVLFFVCLASLPRYIRTLAGSRGSGPEPLSTEDADEKVYALTGLRPRR